jgi:two-component system phosphate regulon sensor histidine kinase PhoR
VAADDALGHLITEVLPAWGALTSQVELVEPGAAARPVTVPLTVAGCERWVAVSGVDFGQGTVYALRDMTEEYALEKTRSDFVATASHELRTPLAAVYGAVRTLRRADVALGEDERAQFLEMIESEAARLGTLVDQILLTSQLDAGAVEVHSADCDPAQIAAGVVESAAMHAPKHISLAVSSNGSPRVIGDESKLRQVLANLVDNAVKYSPDGGLVEIRLSDDNGHCLIAVADEGLGIPADELDRIFEKFYRLDPEQTHGVGGSGLGLYICRELVERMSGSLTVASELDRGSTFTVELPLRR